LLRAGDPRLENAGESRAYRIESLDNRGVQTLQAGDTAERNHRENEAVFDYILTFFTVQQFQDSLEQRRPENFHFRLLNYRNIFEIPVNPKSARGRRKGCIYF
jgi:hypothetical protein